MPLALIFAVMLGIVALTFVLVPLYHQRLADAAVSINGVDTQKNVPAAPAASAITEREQAARGALQEVELDYQLGNISEEDYNILRERYTRRALVALKLRHEQVRDGEEVVAPNRDEELDELIEEQLRRLKERRADATD